MSQTDALIIETTAGPQALDDMAAALNRVWSENPRVPDDVRTQMDIAVAEIGANVVEHAAPGRIRCEVRVIAGQIRVDLFDDGRPTDVDPNAASLPDDFAERGRGLALAKAVLAELSYGRDPDNHWTLVSRSFS